MTPELPCSAAPLLPHRPPMVLIDRLLSWDEHSVSCSVTITDDAPFCEDGRVPSYVSVEYMAQTVGAWAGLRALRAGAPVRKGFLLGTRSLRLEVPFFPAGATLTVRGRCLAESPDGLASFDCEVEMDRRPVAAARLNVFQPDDPDRILTGSTA